MKAATTLKTCLIGERRKHAMPSHFSSSSTIPTLHLALSVIPLLISWHHPPVTFFNSLFQNMHMSMFASMCAHTSVCRHSASQFVSAACLPRAFVYHCQAALSAVTSHCLEGPCVCMCVYVLQGRGGGWGLSRRVMGVFTPGSRG